MQPDPPKNITDYYKHLSIFWTDLAHLMSSKPQALASVGMMREFAAVTKGITTELVEINSHLMDFSRYTTEYYAQLAETWAQAQKKVDAKAPDIPHDVEHLDSYKRIWMDIFDSDFTELFDSEKFGKNYGNLVSKELELTRHWNKIISIVLHSVNMPTKEEMDEVYKEIHSIKKRLSRLEIDIKKNRRPSKDEQ